MEWAWKLYIVLSRSSVAEIKYVSHSILSHTCSFLFNAHPWMVKYNEKSWSFISLLCYVTRCSANESNKLSPVSGDSKFIKSDKWQQWEASWSFRLFVDWGCKTGRKTNFLRWTDTEMQPDKVPPSSWSHYSGGAF